MGKYAASCQDDATHDSMYKMNSRLKVKANMLIQGMKMCQTTTMQSTHPAACSVSRRGERFQNWITSRHLNQELNKKIQKLTIKGKHDKPALKQSKASQE